MTKRRPPGIPTGGQFAATVHGEPDMPLDPGLVATRTGDDNDFEWRLPNGDLHRADGPAVQTDGGVAAGGYEGWYREGWLHRIGGPAIRYAGGVAAGGGEQWWLNGRKHRIDGPAVQWNGGVTAGGTEEFWLDGVRLTAGRFRLINAGGGGR